jgi:hypothetical protein
MIWIICTRRPWESDRPKSCSELVDGRDQSTFLKYVTPGEYGTRKEGVFISVNSGVDYSNAPDMGYQSSALYYG